MLSTLEKLVFVTWVVALASTFLGVFVDFNLFGESAAECEYAANSGKYAGQTAHVTENIFSTFLFILVLSTFSIIFCLYPQIGLIFVNKLANLTKIVS